MNLVIIQGDITTMNVDAIVNAANVSLMGGGGVDGAIHRAAGPELLDYIRYIPVSRGIRCATAATEVTPGFNLPASWIIHTVGPRFDGSRQARMEGEAFEDSEGLLTDPDLLLRKTIATVLDTAIRIECETLAMPAISCGVFGGSLSSFVPYLEQEIEAREANPMTVFLVLFSDKDMQDVSNLH